MNKMQQASTHSPFKLILSSILIGLLSACGGGGGSSSPAPAPEAEVAATPEPAPEPAPEPVPEPEPTLSGVIVNGVVGGLRFETPTQSGLTNDSGEFIYLEGETVTFSIGGIALGSTLAAAEISPFDLVQSAPPATETEMRAELNNNAVNDFDIIANISLFLVSLDNDQNPDNGLDLTGWDETLAGASLVFNENLYSFYDKTFKYFAIDHNANKHVKFSAPLIHLYENLGITIEANIQDTLTKDTGNDGSINFFSQIILGPEGKPETEFTDLDNDGNKEIVTTYIYDETETTTTEHQEKETDGNDDGVIDSVDTSLLTFNKATGLLESQEDKNDIDAINSATTRNTFDYDDERNLKIDLLEREFDVNGNATLITKITSTYNAYDELEFQTTKKTKDGNQSALTSKTTVYAFPGKPKLITTQKELTGNFASSSNVSETYTYDDEGNLEEYRLERFSDTPGNDSKIIQTYRPHANANPLTHIVERDNDADGEIDSIVSTTYALNDSGNVLGKLEEEDSDANGTFENSKTTTYIYDDNQFMKSETITTDRNLDGLVDFRFITTKEYHDNNTLKEKLEKTDSNGDNISDIATEDFESVEYFTITNGLQFLLKNFKENYKPFRPNLFTQQ